MKERLALVPLGLSVVGGPLLLGGVPAWARLGIAAGSWLSLLAAYGACRHRLKGAPAPLFFFVGLGLALVTALSLTPMPMGWLSALAPDSAEGLRATQAALGLPAPGWGSWSMDPGGGAAALVTGLGMLSSALAAWLLAAAGQRRAVLWLVVTSAAVMALVALGHEAAGLDRVFGVYEPRFVHPHPLAPLLNLNHLAALLSVGAVVSLGLAAELRGGKRAACYGLSATLVATTLLTLSRGGVASLLAAGLVFGLLARFGRRGHGGDAADRLGRLWALGALGGGVALGAYLGLDALLEGLGDTTVAQKLEVAGQGLRLALAHPFLGVGKGAFGSASAQLWGETQRALFAEDLPIQWAAEWGFVVAFAALAGLAYELLRVFRRRRSLARLGAALALMMLGVHELADFSTELAGVGTVAAALYGATVGRDHASSRRWRARRLTLLPLGLTLLALLALGPWVARTDALAAQDALEARRQAADADRFHRLLVAAMEAHPQDAAFPLLGGAEAVGRGAPEALPLLNRAMQLAPGWASPHELTARWLLQHGRRDQALGELRRAAMRDARLAAPLLCSILRASPDAALGLRATPPGEEGEWLLDRLARCTRHAPEVAEALDAELLRRAPDHVTAYVRRADRQARAGDVEAALRGLGEASAAHPGSEELRLARARLLVDAGRADQALAALEGHRFADRGQALRVEARARAASGDAEGMRRAIAGLRSLAAGKARPLAEVLLLQARLELELGNSGRAMAVLERSFRLDHRQSTLLQLARVAERIGARAQARSAYQRLLRLAPHNAHYRRAFVRVGGRLDPE